MLIIKWVSKSKLQKKIKIMSAVSGVGKGKQGERSPAPTPKPEKVVDIWCYLRGYILSEKRQKSSKNLVKNYFKKSIFLRDFDQKSATFS